MIIRKFRLDEHDVSPPFGDESDLVEHSSIRSARYTDDANVVDSGTAIDVKEAGTGFDPYLARSSGADDCIARRSDVCGFCASAAGDQDGEHYASPPGDSCHRRVFHMQ